MGREADRADPHRARRRARRLMKVVIFCGGMGIRMGEATQRIPKPMIQIGGRPILWHIMKYYASWGHNDFVLCLGYKAEAIKEFFLTYNEALANDFVLSAGGTGVHLLRTDIDEWTITFVDTGMQATIGERLKAVESFLAEDEIFLATYGDGLTDAPLDDMVNRFTRQESTAMFIQVRPTANMHVVDTDEDGIVRDLRDFTESQVFINGGFFVLRRGIFDEIEPGDELVDAPFRRLIEQRRLSAYRYDGFWAPMDTLKDKQRLETLWESGRAPWRMDAVSVPR
jgi:glucose-1-phosphate cytidylyltransferase